MSLARGSSGFTCVVSAARFRTRSTPLLLRKMKTFQFVSNLGRQMQTVIAHGMRSDRGIAVEMSAARSALARRQGPCRGLASLMRSQRPLPAGCPCEKAAMRKPERQPQRSLRQLASVVPSPPLYRTCHDVGSSASWPTEISVSPTTKRVNQIITHKPHPSAGCLRRAPPGPP